MAASRLTRYRHKRKRLQLQKHDFLNQLPVPDPGNLVLDCHLLSRKKLGKKRLLFHGIPKFEKVIIAYQSIWLKIVVKPMLILLAEISTDVDVNTNDTCLDDVSSNLQSSDYIYEGYRTLQ